MTRLEIMDGNALIALFMGGEKRKGGPYGYFYSGMAGRGACDPHDFRYHSDWEWIMPVVQKIDRLNSPVMDVDVLNEHKQKVTWLTISESIESVWSEVIKFIHWYNDNYDEPEDGFETLEQVPGNQY